MRGVVWLAAALAAADAEPPLAGRPAHFTGWTGQFAVRAEAQPAAVALGQGLWYTVTIQGTGTPGEPPNPMREARFSERFELVEALDPVVAREGDSILAEYRFKLAPKSVAVKRIPPLAWSYYDDAVQGYQTVWTSSIPIEVAGPPVASPVEEAPQAPAESSRTLYALWALAGAAGLIVLWRFVRSVDWSGPAAGRVLTAPQSPEAASGARSIPSAESSGGWGELRNSDEPPDAGRLFRSKVARLCGLNPATSTTPEILAAVERLALPEEKQVWSRLLADLDRLSYGPPPSEEWSRDLANRLAQPPTLGGRAWDREAL
jgi:hypothetical protein